MSPMVRKGESGRQTKLQRTQSIVASTDPSVRRWYDNLARGSEITADVYLRRLGSFCEQNQLTPSTLIECMGYLPIPPSGLRPGYCGSPTPPSYMASIFATLILAGLVLLAWSIIDSAHSLVSCEEGNDTFMWLASSECEQSRSE